MKKYYLLSLLCVFGLFATRAFAQPARPVLSHEPPASVVSGQPLRIVARVSGEDPVAEVNMHLAQSGGAAPVKLPMRSAGAGVYSTQVRPELFAGVDDFRYYLDARTEAGAITESNWMTVRVIDGGTTDGGKKSDWKRPALIGVGAVVAVGAGVAIAGGGGGGGGGGDADAAPIDPADQVIVRTGSDQADGTSLSFPRVTVLDVGGDLAGRSIRRIRVRLEFNGEDGGEEEYEVSYNGATILAGRTGTSIVEQVDVVGAADTQVVIRVLSSVPADGTNTFRWSATVTYFVE
ncbi:MAG: hypothetical protein WD708_10985 [Kiritimatiellia bacterium]